MTNQFWDQQEMDALFTVAEDIYRFDPWESRIAPFVLQDPHAPEPAVLVVFGKDDTGMRDIRLILGTVGIRNWLLEGSWGFFEDTDIPNIEDIVNRFEGSYLEVGYNTPNLNNYEKRSNSDRHRPITFRRQRPGFGLASMVDTADYVRLLSYLKAILKLLTRGMLGSEVEAAYHSDMVLSNTMLTAACFGLTRNARWRKRLLYFLVKKPLPPHRESWMNFPMPGAGSICHRTARALSSTISISRASAMGMGLCPAPFSWWTSTAVFWNGMTFSLNPTIGTNSFCVASGNFSSTAAVVPTLLYCKIWMPFATFHRTSVALAFIPNTCVTAMSDRNFLRAISKPVISRNIKSSPIWCQRNLTKQQKPFSTQKRAFVCVPQENVSYLFIIRALLQK